MAKQQPVAPDRPPSKRDEQQEADRGTGENGREDEVARYEQELRDYLQERIKPGLNRGNIPLVVRSIAKEIAQREHLNGASEDDEDSDESLGPPDLEADMHELQAELGEDWIVRFSVQGDEAWLTAEKDDGTQRVEAPTGEVLAEAVRLLNERGGRSTLFAAPPPTAR